MRKSQIPTHSCLTPSAQAIGLQHNFPFGLTKWDRFNVCWFGELSPSEFSRTYSVELQYRIRENPNVWVRNPDLKQLTSGRKLPHVYEQETQRLCLYFPGVGFWRPNKALAQTLLPWTSLWLHTFEIWLVTDVWHTEGIHPDRTKSVKNSKFRQVETKREVPLGSL